MKSLISLLISNEKYTYKSSWLNFFLIKKKFSRIINYDNEVLDEHERNMLRKKVYRNGNYFFDKFIKI